LWITQLQNQLQNESYNNLIYIMSIINNLYKSKLGIDIKTLNINSIKYSI
jgi:hypothetical protein